MPQNYVFTIFLQRRNCMTIKPFTVAAKVIFISWKINLTIQNLKIIPYNQKKMQIQHGALCLQFSIYMDRDKRIWYLSLMRAAKVQASLRIRAVSPEPSLLVHTSSESRGTFSQKARSLAPLNGWACAVKICHDWILEDTNSLDGAHIVCRGAVFIIGGQ